jgi:hypothetical protein
MSCGVSMTSHSFKFGGESTFNVFTALAHSWLNRYANRCARFTHAYASGLNGPEAAWANRKYHGHRTLPPEMLLAAKKWAQEAHEKSRITSHTVP